MRFKLTIFIVVLVVIGSAAGLAGYNLARRDIPGPFERLSVRRMREEIVAKRDLAISRAKSEGLYRCCIEPPCTMCFMEANRWNNFTAGTCACDELIAQGKEPCPQCVNDLCPSSPDQEGSCPISYLINVEGE